MAKDVYDVGEIPPVGEVPTRMHAQLVRAEPGRRRWWSCKSRR